jgi:hypothetical protein
MQDGLASRRRGIHNVRVNLVGVKTGSQLIGRQRQELGAGADVLGKISKGVLPTPISW